MSAAQIIGKESIKAVASSQWSEASALLIELTVRLYRLFTGNWLLETDNWRLATQMSAIRDIPFRSIPHQSSLFLNYLALSPHALRFYRHPPTLAGLLQAARGKLSDLSFPRKAVASILHRQNEMYGGDSKALNYIRELEEPDTVAILTGQQVGVFTGPLYTVYKALTAIHISGKLRAHGIKAVPIFWMDKF